MALFSSAGRIFFARGAGFRSCVRARIVFFEPLICKRWFNAWGVAKIGCCEFHSSFSLFFVWQNVLFFCDGTHVFHILGILSSRSWFFAVLGAGRLRAPFFSFFLYLRVWRPSWGGFGLFQLELGGIVVFLRLFPEIYGFYCRKACVFSPNPRICKRIRIQIQWFQGGLEVQFFVELYCVFKHIWILHSIA